MDDVPEVSLGDSLDLTGSQSKGLHSCSVFSSSYIETSFLKEQSYPCAMYSVQDEFVK